MTKKILSFMMAAWMLMMGGVGLAEDAAQTQTLIGTVTEVEADGGYLVTVLGEETAVRVLTDEETREEGEWIFGLGDVLVVIYTEMDEEAEIPEVMAEVIRSHTVEGDVMEVDAKGNRLLVNSLQSGQVWATLPEGAEAGDYEVDSFVRMYFGGIFALSFPAQMTAYTVEAMHVETGVVKEVDAGSFLMTWGESELRVNVDDQTKAIDSYNVGDTVQVYYNGIMSRSLPGQIYAVAVYRVQP